MNGLHVEKYGGSSVATPEKILAIAKTLVEKQQQHIPTIVVVSAMGKRTNELIALSEKVSEIPSKREMDRLMATGELVSIAMMAMAIETLGGKAISLSGSQAGVLVHGPHGHGKIAHIDTDAIQAPLNEGYIPIVAGFQGLGADGDIYTLGRGGSDVTATALAAALDCPCYIYTDVPGIHTVDPHRYPEARCLRHMSYDEAMAMAAHGAKIMEPIAVEIAREADIPIYVAKALGDEDGTLISSHSEEEREVVGMAIHQEICLAHCQKKSRPLRKVVDTLTSGEIVTLFAKEDSDEFVVGLKPADVHYAHRLLPWTEVNDRHLMEMITVIHKGSPTLKESLCSLLASRGCLPYHVEPGEGHISFVVEKSRSSMVVETLGHWLNL